MKSKIAVIGSGIVGILSAYFLNKRGFDVKVYEKRQSAGLGASLANGSQVSFSHIIPMFFINNTNFLRPFKKSSISNSINKKDINVKKFLEKQREEVLYEAQHLESLISLAEESYNNFKKLIKEEEMERYIKEGGIVHLFQKASKIGKELEKISLFSQPFEVLNKDEILEIEPNVGSFDKPFSSGIYFKNDATSNCHDICKVLENILKERGVEFFYKTEILNFKTENDLIKSAITSTGETITADYFVVTNGCDAPELLKCIDVKCDIFPVRGYSYTFNVEKSNYAPFIGLIDRDKKMVYSLYKTYLRVAGFMDLGINTPEKIALRMKDFENEIFTSFPLLKRNTIVHKWTDNRPFTPSSVPIVGTPKEFKNLAINAGHGALGFTLSFGTGKLISDLI